LGRLSDELVSRMVQAGKMEAHDFSSPLRSVAEQVDQAEQNKKGSSAARWGLLSSRG
jgi:hypothetical protein